jgi:hypothetical protein
MRAECGVRTRWFCPLDSCTMYPRFLQTAFTYLMLSPARFSLLNPPNSGLLWKISASVWYTRPTACATAAGQVQHTRRSTRRHLHTQSMVQQPPA